MWRKWWRQQMLIEIYDYAAKLLNNMTARTATIINNLVSNATSTLEEEEKEEQEEAEQEQQPNPRTATNLTYKLLQATTGNMKTLLNRTLATIATAQHATLPQLLLHGGLAADMTSGQRIRQVPSSISNSSAAADADTTTNAHTNTTTNPILLSNSSGVSGNSSDVGGNSSQDDVGDMYNAFSTTSLYPSASSNLSGFIESSTTAASTVLSNAITHLPSTSIGPSATTTFPAQTMATFIAAGNKNRATTIIVYPTVSPESIVIPIVSCIFGFPILALIVICCLRRRAKLARERDRRRNYDMQDHAVSLVRFSPIHRLNYRSSRAISLRPERSLSQGFTSLELDTVLEERCSDVEQTQTEILNPESPMDTNSYKMSFSSS